MSISCPKNYAITVNPPYQINLTSSLNPTLWSTLVTFTGTTSLTGTMSFFVDGVLLGTSSISGGSAHITWNPIFTIVSQGVHIITATSGSGMSNPLSQMVSPDLIIDSHTVSVFNQYATFLGGPANFTTLLSGASAYIQTQGPGSSGFLQMGIGSGFEALIYDASNIDSIRVNSHPDNGYPSGAPYPIGTFSIDGGFPAGYAPAGFVPTNPPNWPPTVIFPMTLSFA